MTDSESAIGRRLAEARKDLGISQTAAATRCGWESQSRISMYERGKRAPDYSDLARLAAAYGVRQEWILTGEEPKRGGSFHEKDQTSYDRNRALLIGVAHPRTDGTWAELKEPKRGAIAISAPTDDPSGYLVQVRGSVYYPAILDGQVLTVEPSKPLVMGERVYLRTTDGLSRICELLFERGDDLTFISPNDSNERVVLNRSEIEFVHLIGPILPRSFADEALDEAG